MIKLSIKRELAIVYFYSLVTIYDLTIILNLHEPPTQQ